MLRKSMARRRQALDVRGGADVKLKKGLGFFKFIPTE
jgi:hypothetical protein